MRLTSIELFGFKSFPDRTLLSFDDGLTMVVGPNGSGKSNISDAIRWVLGETSYKSVRSSKMEDVIFGGADTRRPSGFAEVTITIDNTGENRIPVDYDEVSVTRRCYRGGDSDYLINGKSSRLKDIQEMFMNTGLGRSGYSIIGQGRVAEILSQRSEDRRGIFEEAAGISKYRFKKHEAENKLTAVSDDMVRIYDILRELQTRVGPLEKDAEKARKYLEIYEEKKTLDISLWLLDMDTLRVKLKETTAAFEEADEKLKESEACLEELEKKSDELYGNTQENKLAVEQLNDDERSLASEKSDTESLLAVSNNDIEHTSELIAATEEDIRILKEAVAALELKAAELEEKHTSLEAAEREISEKKTAADASSRELEDLRAENTMEQAKTASAIDALSSMQVDSRLRLSGLSGAHSTDNLRRSALEDELQEYLEAEKQTDTAIERSNRTIESFTKKLDEIAAQLEEEKKQNSEDRRRIEEMTADCASLSAEKLGKAQRADALKRMEEHFEGYNQSVRAVMNAAENGQLSGICGPVSHIISVDKKFTLAVETALGNALQNIIVEDENAAKAASEDLKRSGGGRATFCPITSVKSDIRPSDIPQDPRGFLGMADTLCGCDEKYAEVIRFLLGRCSVFDNLDNASYSAKKTGYRIKAVTTDGQLINAGGTFTGGSAKRDSGVLTRNADIEKLTAEIKELELHIAAIEKEIRSAEKAIEEKELDLNSFDTEKAMTEKLISAEQTQLSVLLSRKENDEKQIASINEELDKITSKAKQDQLAADQLEKEIAERDAVIAEAQKTRAELEEKEKEYTASIGVIQKEISSLLVLLASAKKDTEAAEAAVAQAASDKEAALARLEKLNARRVELTQRRGSSQSIISEAKEKLAAYEKQLDSIVKRRTALIEEGAKKDAELSALRTKIKDLNRDHDIYFRAQTKLSSERDSMLAEQDKLTGRIWDDYELTYSTALETGIPPLPADQRPEAASRQSSLRSKIKALGPVNVGAIDEYTDVKTRCDFMTSQYDDLTKSRDDLTKVIIKLEEEMRERFTSVMAELNEQFKYVFTELFGGGTAELKLSDPEDVLTSGIEINVAPPGKIIKSLSLLSGGEQAFVAIAIFFAILRVNPTPFAVLDEIEAALDEINVARFAAYMKRFYGRTQFIVITHRRGTMESADTIYGITMPERGISKVLKLNVTEVGDKLGLDK